MDYYKEIKNKLIDDFIYSKVKDYSKERHKVMTYFEIGRLLNEAGGKYGDNIIDEYSKKLVVEIGRKYNRRTLFRIKQFYIAFNNEKLSTMSTQLSWSHYTELLPIKNQNEMLYYLNLCVNQHISVRALRKKIKNNEYGRLDDNVKLKLNKNNGLNISDNLKHPIIIKNRFDTEEISEKMLKGLILEDISSFMLELGEGFSFISSEYKIKIGNRYNYIDLLLFNYKYNCFVVIELKVTELKKEHIGQIKLYMNYIDKNIKTIYQDKTIGIIIAKRDNKFVMEYCSDPRIYRTTYQLV